MTAAAGAATGLGAAWAAADRVKRRWQAGDAPDAAEAVAAHPELAGCRSVVIDLAYQEYLLREEAGEAPDPGSFAARFPDFRDSVRDMLDAHRLLVGRPELLDRTAGDWPEVGSWFEGLELAAELGRGAFGRAYLAFDPGTDRLCALKLAPGGAAEAQLIGKLAHPHVTDVYWARPVGGRTAVCMPFLGVATLADVIATAYPAKPDGRPTTAGAILAAAEADGLAGQADRRSAPVVRADEPYQVGACAVGARIAAAVGYLHGRGVIHGDLKPSNVVVGPGGAPHLIDFNLADGEAPPAAVRGTPAYMAPELIDAALGERPAGGIDGRRADLFALGVVLFELLTGKHPYRPDGSAGLADLAAAARRGPATLPGTIPPAVAAAVTGCLAPDPCHRPASSEAIAAALDRYVTGRRTRGRRRRRIAAALVCVAVLGALSPINLPAAPAPAVEPPPRTAADFFARGLRSLRAGDPNGARADFVTAHGRSGNPKALAFAAYCHALSGQSLPAADLGRRAIQDGADSAEVRNTVGYALIQASRPREALDHLDRALVLSPNMQAARYNRALARYQLALAPGGKPDVRAVDDIRAALAAGPPSGDLHLDAAQIYAVCSVLDPTLRDTAIEQLCTAARAGKDPATFRKNLIIRSNLARHPGFEAACQTPRGLGPGQPVQLRLVEPRP